MLSRTEASPAGDRVSEGIIGKSCENWDDHFVRCVLGGKKDGVSRERKTKEEEIKASKPD